MSKSPEWITTQEAAERLGVTTARIRQMVAEGRLTGQKMGGKYRGQWQIKSSDVEIKKHTKGVTHTMRVKNIMTPSPITAAPKTNYNQALRLMQENHIKSLPIVDKDGKLTGIVTYADMLKAEPSPVSTLSMFEMVSILDKITMDRIMSSPVYAIDENCSVTNAASFMLDKDIQTMPVVKDNQLVGIITDTDIFKTYVDITGGGKPGTHIEARMPDEAGQLAPFIKAISDAGSYIVSVVISYSDDGFGHVDVKERGGDEDKLREELKKLDKIDQVNFRASGQDELLKFG